MAIKKSQLYSALWESCNALRGSMDASQYKDYVLIILFVKYLSDKAGQPGFRLKVPEGCSFKDFVALKQDDKIGEKIVHHQARKYGTSKFGLNRFFNGYLDLITLWFLSNFGKKPMHVFGFLGSLMFLIGFIAIICIGADKAYALLNHIPQRLITDTPYFFIALTTMLLGSQFFLAGFIGDLISRQNPNRNDYQIEETI